jgi:hypothetical protein
MKIFVVFCVGFLAMCGSALGTTLDTPAECALVSRFDHGLLRDRDVDNTFSLYFNTPSMSSSIPLDWVDAHFIVNPTGSDFLPQHNFRISSSDGLMWNENRMGEGRIALAAGDRVVYSFTWSAGGIACDTDIFEVTVPAIDIDIDNTLLDVDVNVDELPAMGAFTDEHGQTKHTTQQVGAAQMQTQGISEPRIVHPTEEQITNNGHEVVQPSIRASSSVKSFNRPALAMQFTQMKAKATPQVQKQSTQEQLPAKQQLVAEKMIPQTQTQAKAVVQEQLPAKQQLVAEKMIPQTQAKQTVQTMQSEKMIAPQKQSLQAKAVDTGKQTMQAEKLITAQSLLQAVGKLDTGKQTMQAGKMIAPQQQTQQLNKAPLAAKAIETGKFQAQAQEVGKSQQLNKAPLAAKAIETGKFQAQAQETGKFENAKQAMGKQTIAPQQQTQQLNKAPLAKAQVARKIIAPQQQQQKQPLRFPMKGGQQQRRWN